MLRGGHQRARALGADERRRGRADERTSGRTTRDSSRTRVCYFHSGDRDTIADVDEPQAASSAATGGPIAIMKVASPALVVLASTLAAASLVAPARAETDDGAWRVRSTGRLTLDAGLVAGHPAALDTGLSTGVGAGATFGRTLALAVRASWSTATESSTAWSVTQDDLRLRLGGSLQRDVGRGRFALRLGLGPTIVHEARARNQGARAGLTGSALETTAWSTLPTADLEGVVAVHVAGPWLLVLSGGASVSDVDGHARAGFIAQLGTGWQR
jgi:hypothetical protein